MFVCEQNIIVKVSIVVTCCGARFNFAQIKKSYAETCGKRVVLLFLLLGYIPSTVECRAMHPPQPKPGLSFLQLEEEQHRPDDQKWDDEGCSAKKTCGESQ